MVPPYTYQGATNNSVVLGDTYQGAPAVARRVCYKKHVSEVSDLGSLGHFVDLA